MEGEKAAAAVNEELHFQSSPVDFEAIFSLLKRRQSENESGAVFRKLYRRKMNKVPEEERRKRSLIESDAGGLLTRGIKIFLFAR